MTTISPARRRAGAERVARRADPGLLRRALWLWCGLAVAAFVNGALRALVLEPTLGESIAAAVSALLLALIVVLAGGWLVRTSAPHSFRVWLIIGALWAGLTLAFELAFFGLAMGVPQDELLASLDPRRGGGFGLVLLVMLLAPPACAALRS